MNDVPTIGAAIAAAISAVVAYLQKQGRDADKRMEERIAALETKVGPFWKMLEDALPRMLKSPHTQELDVLLEKFEDKSIMPEGLVKMKELLNQEIVELKGKPEAILYALFIPVVEARLKTITSLKSTVGAVER